MAVYSPSGSGQVHIDILLTNVSMQWPLNTDFVGPSLFPQVPIKKQSDKYGIFDRENFKLEAHTVRAPGTIANEIPGLRWSTDTYYASERALQIPVTDEERENVDPPLQPEIDGTNLVTQRLLMAREYKMMQLATTAGNYASANTVALTSGSTDWATYATSDPVGDIRKGVRQIHSLLFMPPNIAVIPYRVLSWMEDHPDFIERIKYSERAILTQDIIAAIIGISNVKVPGVGYSAAGTGVPVTTSTVSYMWPKSVILAYVPPSAGLRQVSFGYEFVWPIGGQQMVVDRWREEPRVSDIIRVRRRYDIKLTGYETAGQLLTGYLITGAIGTSA